jgi:membrane protein implicated in regulation of membrane protease activity
MNLAMMLGFGMIPTILTLGLTIFSFVVAWRLMKAHERLAQAQQNLAQSQEKIAQAIGKYVRVVTDSTSPYEKQK